MASYSQILKNGCGVIFLSFLISCASGPKLPDNVLELQDELKRERKHSEQLDDDLEEAIDLLIKCNELVGLNYAPLPRIANCSTAV